MPADTTYQGAMAPLRLPEQSGSAHARWLENPYAATEIEAMMAKAKNNVSWDTFKWIMSGLFAIAAFLLLWIHSDISGLRTEMRAMQTYMQQIAVGQATTNGKLAELANQVGGINQRLDELIQQGKK